jgi:hypothetical protein
LSGKVIGLSAVPQRTDFRYSLQITVVIVSCRAENEAKERAEEERQQQERASIALKHQKLKHDIAERFLQEANQFVQKVGLARNCF